MKLSVIFILFALSGCFTQKSAKKQFGKVAAVYPEIPADYCARIYPPREVIKKGLDSIRVDTLWGQDVIYDTIVRNDTVRIYIKLPGQVITRTVVRTDTIYAENKAKIDFLNIELGKALTIATDKIKESGKWRRIAFIRFWAIMGISGLSLFFLTLFIRKNVIKNI